MFKEVVDGVNGAPSKSLHMRMGLEVVDECLEIVDRSPYCSAKCHAKLLNTIIGLHAGTCLYGE